MCYGKQYINCTHTSHDRPFNIRAMVVCRNDHWCDLYSQYAFLTQSGSETGINSIEDLGSQGKVEYGEKVVGKYRKRQPSSSVLKTV